MQKKPLFFMVFVIILVFLVGFPGGGFCVEPGAGKKAVAKPDRARLSLQGLQVKRLQQAMRPKAKGRVPIPPPVK